ncbi:unnamed protein product [Owenia fusiformis]|uniref:SOCS box domain-containing protein n=1 Tax=Owenia fusiformis TaxID=6347 RepID=A0A8S4NQ10_OWEFU|nr:unnamed protein product [Owenia fusiformis]
MGLHFLDMQLDTDKDADAEDVAIVAAAQDGDMAMVTRLLDEGCDVNKIGPKQCNAMHKAVKNGHLEMVTLLQEHGADVNAPMTDQTGHCPLTISAVNDNVDIMHFLLKSKNIKINQVTKDQLRSALHIAVLHNNPSCIKLLLSYHCDVTMKDFTGNTPIGLAVVCNMKPCVEEFVHHGCNMNVLSYPDLHISPGLYWKPHTLVETALLNRNQNMAELLVNNGATVGNIQDYVSHNSNYTTERVVILRDDANLWVKERKQHPRPLSELSRYQIRKLLGSNMTSKVMSLPLPSIMQHYLTNIHCE